MSVVENEIQKLKSLLDQSAKGLQSIDPKAAGDFELESIKQRRDKLLADLRQKEMEIGLIKKQAEAPDLNKLETRQKNLESEKKKLEEEIRQVVDDSRKNHGQLQAEINKIKTDLESLKAEAARLTVRIQGAVSVQKQAENEIPKIVVAIEKAEKEEQLKNRERLEKKAAKELEERLAREKKLQDEAEGRLQEAEAIRKKQEQESAKKREAAAQEKVKQKEIQATAGLIEADKESEKKVLRRKQRAQKRLRGLQEAAHRRDSDAVRTKRMQYLKGVAQRGGMSAKQKEEYERLKSQDIESKAK